jgi:hypothetical protein
LQATFAKDTSCPVPHTNYWELKDLAVLAVLLDLKFPKFESSGIKFPETTQRKNHRDGAPKKSHKSPQKDIVAQKTGQKGQSP